MRIFGSISRLVSLLFRKDGQDITVRPNQSTTYTSGRDMQLPPGDADQVLVSETSTQTLTNKTLGAGSSVDADVVSVTNIENADIKAGAAIDASKLADGSVSNTEFQYLSGVTSDIQTQLGDKQDTSEKGVALGYASLDAGGKIPVSQLPSSVMEFKGAWDASTNSPALADGTGDAGDIYRASVAGSQNLGSGSLTFGVGDWVMYNGTIWQRSPATDAVTSVNSLTGAVSLDTDDIPEGTALYFTDERAQDAVGAALTDSASIDFTYNDGGGTITAAVIPGGVDHDALNNFSSNEHIDHSTVDIQTNTNSGLAGGGDLTASRQLSIDPTNAPSVSAAATDQILIADASDSNALKRVSAQSIADLAAGSAAQSFIWTDGSATKSCSHTFSTKAVLVEVYDENDVTVYVDSVDRSSTSQVDLTRSEATVGGNWTVVIRN